MADRNEYILSNTDLEEALRSAITQMHKMADDHLRDYLTARGFILATPEHDAATAAEALREVATEVRQLPPDASPRGIAAAITVKADHIGREGGESDADA